MKIFQYLICLFIAIIYISGWKKFNFKLSNMSSKESKFSAVLSLIAISTGILSLIANIHGFGLILLAVFIFERDVIRKNGFKRKNLTQAVLAFLLVSALGCYGVDFL